MRRILLLIIGVLLCAGIAQGQTAATGNIQIAGIPADRNTLWVGAPGTEVAFVFSADDPSTDGVWVQTRCLSNPLHPQCTVEELTTVLLQALQDHATTTGVTATRADSVNISLTVAAGSAGNDTVLQTDSEYLGLTVFSGGSD